MKFTFYVNLILIKPPKMKVVCGILFSNSISSGDRPGVSRYVRSTMCRFHFYFCFCFLFPTTLCVIHRYNELSLSCDDDDDDDDDDISSVGAVVVRGGCVEDPGSGTTFSRGAVVVG